MKRWLAAIPCVCLLLSAAAEDPLSSGLKALEDRNYSLAVEQLGKAVAADPKDYSAHFNLALANSMVGKPDLAIAGYKKVLELQPGLYQAQINLGMVLLGQKRAAEALPYLDAAAAQKPKDARTRLYLSVALLDTGDLEKAEASYRTALELDPKSAAAELGLARSLAQQNKLADAEPHFRRAAELNPSYRDGLLELAALFEKADRKNDAIAIYKEFPDNVGARERMGLLLVDAGQAADAIPQLEWVVKQSPTAVNRLALAQAYRKHNEPDKALPLLAAAVEAAPADVELRMSCARELRDLRRFPDAAEQFLRVAAAKPDWAQAWNELAGVEIMMENYPQALAALNHVRALKAEIPGDYFLRAMVLDRMKARKEAIVEYQNFLSTSKGEHPNQEFQARQRIRIIQLDLGKR